jgi:hypothetical protein
MEQWSTARHVDAPRKTASHSRKGPGGRCVGRDLFTYRCGLGRALARPPTEAESNGRPSISTGSTRRAHLDGLMRPNVQTGQPSRHPQRRPRRLNTSEDNATAPPRQPHATILADPQIGDDRDNDETDQGSCTSSGGGSGSVCADFEIPVAVVVAPRLLVRLLRSLRCLLTLLPELRSYLPSSVCQRTTEIVLPVARSLNRLASRTPCCCVAAGSMDSWYPLATASSVPAWACIGTRRAWDISALLCLREHAVSSGVPVVRQAAWCARRRGAPGGVVRQAAWCASEAHHCYGCALSGCRVLVDRGDRFARASARTTGISTPAR